MQGGANQRRPGLVRFGWVGLPVAAGVLYGFEQRLLAGGTVGAAVAGHVGVGDAEFGAAA